MVNLETIRPGDKITYVLKNNEVRYLKFKNKDHRDRYMFYVCDKDFNPTQNMIGLSKPN